MTSFTNRVLFSTTDSQAAVSPNVIFLTSEPSIEVTTQVEELRHLVRMKKRAEEEWKEQDKASEGDQDDLLKDDKTESSSKSDGWFGSLLGTSSADESSSASSGVSSSTSSSTTEATRDDSANGQNGEQPAGQNGEQPADQQPLDTPVFNPNVTNPNDDLSYVDNMKKAAEEVEKKDSAVNGLINVSSESDKTGETNQTGESNKTSVPADVGTSDGNKSNGENSRQGKSDDKWDHKSNGDDSKSPDQSDASPSVTQSSTDSTSTNSTTNKIIDALKPNNSSNHSGGIDGRDGQHPPGHQPGHQLPSSALTVDSMLSLVVSLAVLSFAQFQFISRRC